MSEELRQIKKIYGEDMMHLCRELFPSILETEGKLLRILQRFLAPTRSFVEKVKSEGLESDFKAWIYTLADLHQDERIDTAKTPFELMDEAGYTLYECHNEEEIQSFAPFYAKNEKLCTFNGGRLEQCIVFFAVKKNVDEIKRENFPNPERDDEYGTSVISIQFSRDHYCTVSIKNRYNHTVINPDFTFANNLENIIPGLTSSFEKYCNIKIQESRKNSDFLSDMQYLHASNGKYYYVNTEVNGVYYCENNIIILNNKVIDQYSQNKERYILIDQYMVDLKNKTIFNPIDGKKDAFINSVMNIGKIKNIVTNKYGDNRAININYEDGKNVVIGINKQNSIIEYKNNHVKEVDDGFLTYNPNVVSISMSEIEKIGDGFIAISDKIVNIDLPKVKEVGDQFLDWAIDLKKLSLPEVRKIGERFLNNSRDLVSISLPKVEEIGDDFMVENRTLDELILPEVITIGDNFMTRNSTISNLYLPKVEEIGENFLLMNDYVTDLSLPEVRQIGNGFMATNAEIKSVYLPKVEKIGDDFLQYNRKLLEITMPELREVGEVFLGSNSKIEKVFLPKLEKVGKCFMMSASDKFRINSANNEEKSNDESLVHRT